MNTPILRQRPWPLSRAVPGVSEVRVGSRGDVGPPPALQRHRLPKRIYREDSVGGEVAVRGPRPAGHKPAPRPPA